MPAATMQTTMNADMQKCIEDCLNCYRSCTQMAMNDCLEKGGQHVEPEHFRLMVNCAQICQTSADFMLGSSMQHVAVCAICADICDACAQSCEQVGEMDECVQACHDCAESCRVISQSAGDLAMPATLRQPVPGTAGFI